MPGPDENSENKAATAENEPAATEEQSAREPWPEESDEVAQRQQRRSFFRQHPRARWALPLLLIIAAVVLISLWRYYSVRETTDDAQVDGHIYPVSARISGTAIQVNFDENQHLDQGQALVVLDPRDYQVAVDRAKAELQDSENASAAAQHGVPITRTSTSSAIDTARASLAAAEKEVSASEARLRETQANHTKAAQDLQRFQALVTKDEVSRQQYDTALATEQAAAASVDAARASVAAAQSHVTQAQAQVASAMTAPQQVAVTQAHAGSATANVQKSQAALAQAELNLSYTTIRAPVTGVVSKRNVEVGQVVQPGQPMCSIVDMSNLWVTANYKETQLKNMRVGQAAKISVDAYGEEFNGHVDSFGGATGARFSLLPPENATGNYVKVVQRVPVKITFDKGQDVSRLRPGLSVVVTVITQ